VGSIEEAIVHLNEVSRAVARYVVSGVVALLGSMLFASASQAAFPGTDGLLAVQPLHGSGLIVVRSDGRDSRQLCDLRSCGVWADPTWSPDAREIAFLDGGELGVVYADGSCLFCGPGAYPMAYSSPGFTPAGEILTVSRGVVETLGLDGLGLYKLLRSHDRAATWSAQDRLAVVRRVHGRDEVFVTGVNRRTLRQLTFTGASSPSWAPSGRLLAVVHEGSVELIDLNGHVVRVLAQGQAPAYAPDGQRVAYVGAHHYVMVVSARGGQPRRVGAVRGRHVDWQPVTNRPRVVCPEPPRFAGRGLLCGCRRHIAARSQRIR
jgi:Tol biopolymer transport system component